MYVVDRKVGSALCLINQAIAAEEVARLAIVDNGVRPLPCMNHFRGKHSALMQCRCMTLDDVRNLAGLDGVLLAISLPATCPVSSKREEVGSWGKRSDGRKSKSRIRLQTLYIWLHGHIESYGKSFE